MSSTCGGLRRIVRNGVTLCRTREVDIDTVEERLHCDVLDGIVEENR
jgi:hypothetical protein